MNMGATAAAGRILVVDDDRAFRLAVGTLLSNVGHTVLEAGDGPEALARLSREPVDLILLDIGLPGMSGLDVLSAIRALEVPPRVVIVTADDTPETLLKAVRGQADRYVTKPFAPAAIVDIVEDALHAAPAATLPIEVISATPEWVEIVAPCSLAVANRIQAFVLQLDADLPADVRESVGHAFRELLSNAVEWGGHLDPSRTVRISCIRARRMLLYRIADPGEGFDLSGLAHAAISNPDNDPLQHALIREEKGLRPGGLGLAITRMLVDELIYNERRNEVVFVKYLDGAAGG
jgi:CheY-like chemotaxis protein/anti-sigma regulatory factor (Ser/Thr protein kinase)